MRKRFGAAILIAICLLSGQPAFARDSELTTESFAAKITDLAGSRRYIVAEKNQMIMSHALLDPMRLEATAHVFKLTIVVHPGFQNRSVGRY